MKQGRFPCGRMSSVQSGSEPLGYPHCLQWCLHVSLQWYLHVPVHTWLLGYSTSLGRTLHQFFGGPHIWISLVALITGFPWWLSLLDFFGGPHFWIYGQFSGNWISVFVRFNRALTLEVCLEN